MSEDTIYLLKCIEYGAEFFTEGTDPNTILFIIGNGFDIMHRVPSSYYNFRDTVGKNNILRFILETYIRKADVWENFKNSLAYLDHEMMLDTLDDWLSDFDVLMKKKMDKHI